jgi:hypothetical protein
MRFESSAALLARRDLTPMMNDVSFIVIPAAAGFAVLAAVLGTMTYASAGLNARPRFQCATMRDAVHNEANQAAS